MTYLPEAPYGVGGSVSAPVDNTVADVGASPPPFPSSPNTDGELSTTQFLSGTGSTVPQQGTPAITSEVSIAGVPTAEITQNNWGQL